MIDTSKMSKGKQEALEVSEAARQAEWTQPSFAAEIFMGKFREKLIWPYPAQSAEDRKIGDELLVKLEDFLKKNVDADAIDREQEVPDKVLKGLAELGLFGMKIPKKYGGMGLSQVNYNRAIALIGSHCGSTAVWLSAHQSIGVPQPLLMFGTEEQKAKWFPMFAKGAISGFALTESEAGSDPAKVSLTATPSADGKYFTLNGEKLWCTNGLVADVLVVMARTPDREIRGKMRKQITAFIVEKKTAGIENVNRCRFMGIRAIQNGVIRFTNVKVPRENMLSGEGQGLKLALVTLNTGRLTLPAASTGTAKMCVAITRRWANHRVQWGEPIGRHDAVAQKIAAMASTTFAMEAVTYYVSGLADSHTADIRLEAAMAKLFASEAGWKIIDDTLQVMGGRGYETAESLRARGEAGYPVERMMRDHRINRIIEGSSEIMRLFIIREAMDKHMKMAGSLVNPKAAGGIGTLFKDLLKAGMFYSLWYPARWIPRGLPGTFGKYGKLAKHMQWAQNQSNKLGRNLFHLMALNGPGLEKRQAILARVVDIAVDLFAVACTCSFARHMSEHENRADSVELADQFCLQARRRVKAASKSLWSHDDKRHYSLAQKVLAGDFIWLEKGVMPVADLKPGQGTVPPR
jgi:alkylation response protein AidB-like acyl-CoA dehydrogenase